MRLRRSSPIPALIASATADRLVSQGYCQWRRPDGGDAYTGLMDEVSITIG